jgi:predicted phage terminase large subunit-like protein
VTPATLKALQNNLHRLNPVQKAEVLDLLAELERRKAIKLAKTSLLDFILLIDPTYKVGIHHKRLAHLLEDVAMGRKTRISVNIAPRFGKSVLVSTYFPAWFLGNYPSKKVMMASHTADLAIDFGRKVRNLIASPKYQEIFGGKEGVELSQDSKSAGRWHTNHGGEYFAVGIGGAIAGRGADLFLIDDPHNEKDIVNGNMDGFDKAYEWFVTGAITRLMPGGRVAIVQCLVGDTRVLMADNTEKPLRDVRPGDTVASYKDGRLHPAKVLNWANQGLDHIYAVALHSGDIIRGNARHPLLANIDGVEQWVRIGELKPGMSLVSTKGALDPLTTEPSSLSARRATTRSGGTSARLAGFLSRLRGVSTPASPKDVTTSQTPQPSPGCAKLARRESGTTRNTQTPQGTHSGITASGAVYSAVLRVVGLLRQFADCATPVPARADIGGSRKPVPPSMTRTNDASPTSKLGTVLPQSSTRSCSLRKGAGVLSAVWSRARAILLQLGSTTGLPLTTAMTRGEYALCCATSATSLSRKETTPPYSERQWSTLSVIASITPDGVEDVFDIQVEGTENFIANGVVSHNTRWSLMDLTGRLVKDMVMNEGADQYEVVEFPAIIEKEIQNDDGTTQFVQKSLWPEQWSLEALLQKKATMSPSQWQAQYMQNPTSEEGAIVKREWWRVWQEETPPKCEFIIQAWDTAFEKHNRADYSACTTWGVWFTGEGDGLYHSNVTSNPNPLEDSRPTANIILLNAFRERMEFPTLKSTAYEHYMEWKPDAFIVEKKASGAPLIYELRAMGIPVGEYTPSKGNDKISRLNSVSDLFASGIVWAPQTRWAEEVVDEVASFPSGEHDDFVDSLTLALMRFRQGGFLRLSSDEKEEVKRFKSSRRAGYY